MTTEKDKDQARQNVSGPNQDPHRKAPEGDPGTSPNGAQPASAGTRNNTSKPSQPMP